MHLLMKLARIIHRRILSQKVQKGAKFTLITPKSLRLPFSLMKSTSKNAKVSLVGVFLHLNVPIQNFWHSLMGLLCTYINFIQVQKAAKHVENKLPGLPVFLPMSFHDFFLKWNLLLETAHCAISCHKLHTIRINFKSLV